MECHLKDLKVYYETYGEGSPLSWNVDALSTPFNKPTLIFTGRQDEMVGYWDTWGLHEKYPRGSFVTLDRAGHNLQIEQDALFNALVHEWLDRVEEQAQNSLGNSQTSRTE